MGESSSGGALTVGRYCYDPKTTIGNGAFGFIHPGWEKNDVNKKVVIKLIAEDQEARLQEAECQKKLQNHENIVRLFTYSYMQTRTRLGQD